MKDLGDFKQQGPPTRRTSKMKNFRNEILELYSEGYRVEQIQDFLSQNGINVTVDGINRFKRNLSTQNFAPNGSSYIGAGKKPQSQPKVANEPNSSKAINAFYKNMQKIMKEEKSDEYNSN